MKGGDPCSMNNDDKLAALTNEPIKMAFGGEEYTLRRPTIKDYKKIRLYLKEKNAINAKLSDDDSIDFGVFFIATLLINPQYTQEQLEEKILLTDLNKLSEVMEQLGFTKPPTKPIEEVKTETPVPQEVQGEAKQ